MLVGVFGFAKDSFAEILFEDNYDNPGDSGWTCLDSLRTGYTSKSACSDPLSYEGVTHYSGEISSGGRSGNSLKLWRRNGIWTDYSGYLNKDFSEQEFANHYKELFIRWYVKIPPEWDADLGSGNYHKLNRIYIGTSAGAKTTEWYMNVNGSTFKTGKFAFYNTAQGDVYYSEKTITELGVNDGQWHSLEWHLKLNSETGVSDGGFTFYVDGEEIKVNDYRIGKWPGTYVYGIWNQDMGAETDEHFTSALPPGIGNIGDTWNFPTDDWYAFEFDDYVVSTKYIGPSDKSSISSVSGTAQTGQTLLISGSNLLNENNTDWIDMFKTGSAYGFEGTSPTSDRYIMQSGGEPENDAIYDFSVKLMGDKSIRWHIEGASSDCPYGNLGSASYINIDESVKEDYYARFYARWNSRDNLWASSHIKMLYDLEVYYFQPAAGSTLPSAMSLVYDGTRHDYNIPSGTLQNDRWYCFEVRWKKTPPYRYTAWVDGVQIADVYPERATISQPLLIGITNACGTQSGFYLDHWWDNFAVSASRIYPSAVIEIGNSSDYATATKVYQAPMFLSDTSIQITTNLADLGSGPYYLWVTNNEQERSNAYMLETQNVDAVPPASPSGLAVS